jgi:hypothetical protein
MILETSRRSEMSWLWARALRWIVSAARSRSGIEVSATKDVRPPDDRVEWRAQLVGQRGQEVVLGAVGLLGRAADVRLVAEGGGIVPFERPDDVAKGEDGQGAQDRGDGETRRHEPPGRALRALLPLGEKNLLVAMDGADGRPHGIHLHLAAPHALQSARDLQEGHRRRLLRRLLRALRPHLVAAAQIVHTGVLDGVVRNQFLQIVEGGGEVAAAAGVRREKERIVGEEVGAKAGLVVDEQLVHEPGLPDDFVAVSDEAVVGGRHPQLPGESGGKDEDDGDRDRRRANDRPPQPRRAGGLRGHVGSGRGVVRLDVPERRLTSIVAQEQRTRGCGSPNARPRG